MEKERHLSPSSRVGRRLVRMKPGQNGVDEMGGFASPDDLAK